MNNTNFQLVSPFLPAGDQPKAISQLVTGLDQGLKDQILLGVTGSGKTFTIANVIAQTNRPTIVISHNKTLAAQLYNEFKTLFPHNAVCYFVSYYDYYQPEAYLPASDTYIEKDSAINDELDRLRLEATCTLISRRDVIIVSSVSCIYNIGSPEEYKEAYLLVQKGDIVQREIILKKLIEIYYERNDIDFCRGKFRVRGDTIEIFPSYSQTAHRIEMFGEKIERISEISPVSGQRIREQDTLLVYPAKHFVTNRPRIERAILSIEEELGKSLIEFKEKNKLLEMQRLDSRTRYDLELLRETGGCRGIENYSRHFDGRSAGMRPYSLLDYFPEDFLLVIDESHVSIPQIKAMYAGDLARKENLIKYGFRLPSAYDNRPLRFPEFEQLMPQTIFVSATPGPYELEKTTQVVEQIIRPTGLIDPVIEVRPINGQIQDLINEMQQHIQAHHRVLITTLTKRMAEDLADYLSKEGLQVRYLHSEIKTLQRVEILRDLRKGEFDVLVGINLLREGLDLPEVSLVAILDADKEGFLRSDTSLIQVVGRCARNVEAKVIMYADSITGSMQRTIDETNRRRDIQMEYNRIHGIIPQTIKKEISEALVPQLVKEVRIKCQVKGDKAAIIKELEIQMAEAAERMDYEYAAVLRDEIMGMRG
ncbi:MAG: excinuclease ABC subunit UvrB [Candidatus Desantisbacteria bacterium]